MNLQKQLNESRIKGEMVFINAEIKLKGSTLDTFKSNAIINTSDAKCLGIEAYEKGEAITSLNIENIIFC